MKSPMRTGILLLLLVVPVFVFLFLKKFGKNHYSIRKYYPVAIDSTGKTSDTTFHKIPAFSLTNQENENITEQDVRGKIVVADFIFTRCPTICPKMSTQMTRVQDAFTKQNEVKLVSFSVDPERDSVEVLQDYARKYKVRSDKWNLLTGNKKDIYDLARYGFKVSALMGDGGPEDFIHTEKLILVDKEGIIRGYYDGTDPEEVDRLIVEAKILIYEYSNAK
jgi:protein SCO1